MQKRFVSKIYFIIVVYEKLGKKLEKRYLKSENITNSGKLLIWFFVVIAYGIFK